MMTLLEFTIFALYLAMITFTIVLIQIYNPGQFVRKPMEFAIEESLETFDEKVFEEPISDSDAEPESFDPTKESYTMTENPMLRHRKEKEVTAKPIDLEQVD